MAEKPMLPRLPTAEDQEPPPSLESRNFATMLALLSLMGAGAGLLGLLIVVLPQAIYAVIAIAVLPFYFLLHYLLWGRLVRSQREEVDAWQDRSPSEN